MARWVLTNTPLESPVLWRAESCGLQKIDTSIIASSPSPLSLGAVALQEWSETAGEGSPPRAFYHSNYLVKSSRSRDGCFDLLLLLAASNLSVIIGMQHIMHCHKAIHCAAWTVVVHVCVCIYL